MRDCLPSWEPLLTSIYDFRSVFIGLLCGICLYLSLASLNYYFHLTDLFLFRIFVFVFTTHRGTHHTNRHGRFSLLLPVYLTLISFLCLLSTPFFPPLFPCLFPQVGLPKCCIGGRMLSRFDGCTNSQRSHI